MPTRIEKQPPPFFPTVVLYLADVKWLTETIATETESKVTISDGEFTYDSLDDLAASRKEVDQLTIESGWNKSLNVSLYVSRAGYNRLRVSPASSDRAKAVYASIRHMLDDRRRPIACIAGFDELFGARAMIICGVSALVLTVLLLSCLEHGHYFIGGVLALIVSLCYIFFPIGILSSLVSSGRFSRVYLVNRDEKPTGFIGRNWERIAVGLLLVILGAAAKTAYDAVLVKFTSNSNPPPQTDTERIPTHPAEGKTKEDKGVGSR